MWKIFIKLMSSKEYIHVPNSEVGTQGRSGRGMTNVEHRGFTLLSEAISFLRSQSFVNHIDAHYPNDEVVEVNVKFEEVV